jgi:hypothetical protein
MTDQVAQACEAQLNINRTDTNLQNRILSPLTKCALSTDTKASLLAIMKYFNFCTAVFVVLLAPHSPINFPFFTRPTINPVIINTLPGDLIVHLYDKQNIFPHPIAGCGFFGLFCEPERCNLNYSA